MDSNLVAKQELDKLLASGKGDEKIINHPSFRDAFIGLFIHAIGSTNYSVEVKDDSIVIEKTCNYPNATNGIYHGYRDAVRCVIKMEQDYLSVKEESAAIYSFDNHSTENLGYYSRITAYDGRGYEAGYAEFYIKEAVSRGYPALAAIYVPERIGSGRREIPTLNVRSALTGRVFVPHYANIYEWRVNTGSRKSNGVALKYYIEHLDQRTEKQRVTFAYIHSEYPERLYGNNTDFAEGVQAGLWQDLQGNPLSSEELRNMRDEYEMYFKNSNSKDR